MAFKSLSQIRTDAGASPRGRYRATSDIVIATDKGIKNSGKEGWCLRISISSDIAKKARFLAGDRIEFFIDRDSSPACGLLKRTTEKGMRLYKNGESAGARFIYKATYIDGVGIPSFAQATDVKAEVVDDGIMFDIPATCSFDKNLRVDSH